MTTYSEPPSAHYLVDAMSDGLDLIRTVWMALMSEWFDSSDAIAVASTLHRGIQALEPLREALNQATASDRDPNVPTDKLLVDRYIPKVLLS